MRTRARRVEIAEPSANSPALPCSLSAGLFIEPRIKVDKTAEAREMERYAASQAERERELQKPNLNDRR